MSLGTMHSEKEKAIENVQHKWEVGDYGVATQVLVGQYDDLSDLPIHISDIAKVDKINEDGTLRIRYPQRIDTNKVEWPDSPDFIRDGVKVAAFAHITFGQYNKILARPNK